MRKHFLILMLLALLPLAANADNIKITPYNVSKTFGDVDPVHAKSGWFAYEGSLPTGVSEDDADHPSQSVAHQLLFSRLTQGETVGSYRYTYESDCTVSDGTNDHNLSILGDALFTISHRDLTTFTTRDTENPNKVQDAAGNKIEFKLKNMKFVDGSNEVELTENDFDITINYVQTNDFDGKLVYGTDYVIYDFDNNIGVKNNTDITQNAQIIIEGRGNYKGRYTFYYNIEGVNIATLPAPVYNKDNSSTFNLVYSGEPKVPVAGSFTITDGTTVLSFGDGAEDELEVATVADLPEGVTTVYSDNVNAGTCTVYLKGKNGYSGVVPATFPIAKKKVTKDAINITLGAESYEYTGSDIALTYSTKTAGGITLDPEKDFELTGVGVDAGTYHAKVAFKRNFEYASTTGDYQKNVDVVVAPRAFTAAKGLSIEWVEKNGTAEKTNYVYNNADIKPAFKVWYTVDATHKYELTTADYTFKYEDNDATPETPEDLKNVGAKKLIVTGKGNFATTTSLNKAYTVTTRTVKVKAESLEVGMGAEVAPVVVWDAFPAGHDAATLGLTPTITYKRLNAAGTAETGDAAIAQANIKAAAVGKYNIHVDAEALNTAATAAVTADPTSPLKNYTFTEEATFAKIGKLTKTIGQVVVKVVNKTIKFGGIAFPSATDITNGEKAWTVEHVSGLAVADQVVDPLDGITTPMESIIGALDPAKFAFVEAPAAVNASKTGYDVNYNNGLITNASYTITVLPGKLIVDKLPITAAMVTIPATDYTGKAVAPEVTVTPGVADPALVGGKMPTNFFTTVYDEDFNAGVRTAQIGLSEAGKTNYITETKVLYAATDPEVVAGTAVAGTLKETLPYIEKNYTINKVALTITADNFTGDHAWTYGLTEPSYTAKLTAGKAVEGEESLITSLMEGKLPATGFNGKLVVKRISANTVGDHTAGLVPMFVNATTGAVVPTAGAADNYSFTLIPGNLQINKGKMIVKVKDITLAYNGTTAPAAGTFKLEAVFGMDPAEAENFDAIVTYDKAIAKFGYVDAYKAVGPHTLTYKGTAPTATNYDIEFAEGDAANGTLTVTKRPVTFIAVDQAIAYGDPFTPAVNATYIKNITVADKTDATYGKYYDAATCYDLLPGTTMTDLIASVAAESMNVGDNAINLTKKASEIYEIICLPGVLTVGNTGIDITLNRVAKASYDDALTNTAAKLITENDGKFVNVKFSDFDMYGEKWYPLVLPFATTVKKISDQFGYAVVNTFEGTDANGNIQFKLAFGAIPANTPFIVKIYENKNMNAVTFANAKIEKAHDANGEVKIGDASGVQFVGTYKGRVEGFRSNMYYFSTNQALDQYYKGNDTNKTYLRPLGAYFVDNASDAANNAREILIEEADGSTTAISAVEADGSFVEANGWYTVGGAKLESVPTEKGVYIRNGKKVVIK